MEPGTLAVTDGMNNRLFPEWVSRLALPELGNVRPERMMQERLSPLGRQDFDPVVPVHACVFFNHLCESGLIGNCLSVGEGVALINNGIVQKKFPGRHPLLWRSTVWDTTNNLFVPWIQNIPAQHPVIQWWWVKYRLYPSHFTLVFDLD